ncbi:MAG: HD domain-containing protein [Proteobacteria bacterium]|nr:HD domain-containing protein [Pseudomonadota bacterium]
MHGGIDCDDGRFISEISCRFSDRNILENFRAFTEMPAHLRPRIAAFRTNFVDREGWNQIGVKPRVQSLHNHIETLLDMLRHLSPEGTDIARLSEMIEVHDLQEVITNDFTWNDPITKAEKIRIERLAINIIFENHPAKIALWEELCGEALCRRAVGE